MESISDRIRWKVKTYLPFNRKVNFIIAGTQKGGTTALDEYCREHPELCMANKKEVHYFDHEKNFSQRSQKYNHYHAYFSPRKRHKLLGEATPIYMYWKTSPKRMFEYNPELKVILILRNPIERAYSHWNMERAEKADNLSFIEALKTEKERCASALPEQHRVFSYTDRGHYVRQIERLWSYFPKEQTLILKSEALKQDPNGTLSTLAQFLGVSEFSNVQMKDVHSRPYDSDMSEEAKNYLIDLFSPEVQKLEKLLGWDCKDWLR
ncbi:sulfotransferase domain-containing protein [Ningiella sp. W23]|uniref:sulfotransferase domain-containing protein n=1 Tax=Ningiella sp. W23 TaxID=3023715 RepID=UPI003757FA86